MSRNGDDNDTALAVGAVGGGALFLWWLLRGRGFGLGGGGSPRSGPAATPMTAPSPATASGGAHCSVYLRGPVIELNGKTSDLATVVATCAGGTAILRVTGDTRTGAVSEMVHALNAAQVAVLAPDPYLAQAVRDELTLRGRG